MSWPDRDLHEFAEGTEDPSPKRAALVVPVKGDIPHQ